MEEKMIDKKKILKQKLEPDQTKTIKVCIRISPAVSTFLKDQKISPSGLFNEALKEIGYKDKQ